MWVLEPRQHIGDHDFNVAKLYGMLPAGTSGDAKARTRAVNHTVRNVFVIGPDKKVKLILVYPMTTVSRTTLDGELRPVHVAWPAGTDAQV